MRRWDLDVFCHSKTNAKSFWILLIGIFFYSLNANARSANKCSLALGEAFVSTNGVNETTGAFATINSKNGYHLYGGCLQTFSRTWATQFSTSFTLVNFSSSGNVQIANGANQNLNDIDLLLGKKLWGNPYLFFGIGKRDLPYFNHDSGSSTYSIKKISAYQITSQFQYSNGDRGWGRTLRFQGLLGAGFYLPSSKDVAPLFSTQVGLRFGLRLKGTDWLIDSSYRQDFLKNAPTSFYNQTLMIRFLVQR